MQLPLSEHLNIAGLSRLFDNKSECYKLFWFQALLNRVCDGQQEIRFEDLIDDMIANAWYMVTEYHLNLGPRDTLEKSVNYISSTTDFSPTVKQQDILDWLKSCTDTTVLRYKKDLTLNVPFRLQSPFLEDFQSDTWS
ncbi:MAG: HNH endonuclease, partial [Clostridia bacterium]|nr:HNH endonuclease [Clostridia bacterium]